jgi:adenylate kinase family enzyme
MAEISNHRKLAPEEKLALLPEQKAILIAGPAGSGKTSMGRRIGGNSGWFHLSEDRVWDELPRDPHTARTEAGKAIVQAKAVEYIKAELKKGNSVVLEFIVYDNPPQPIVFYQTQLAKLGVPVHTKVLRPTIDDILSRQDLRGNSHDRECDLADRRANAEHQVRCLSSEHIDPSWVVDSSGSSLEDVYRRHFAELVEPKGRNG